jgi:hypothetical protein
VCLKFKLVHPISHNLGNSRAARKRQQCFWHSSTYPKRAVDTKQGIGANLERECRYQTRPASPDDGSTLPCVNKQEIADIVSRPELILASIPTTSSKEATQSRGQNNNAHYNASIDKRDFLVRLANRWHSLHRGAEFPCEGEYGNRIMANSYIGIALLTRGAQTWSRTQRGHALTARDQRTQDPNASKLHGEVQKRPKRCVGDISNAQQPVRLYGPAGKHVDCCGVVASQQRAEEALGCVHNEGSNSRSRGARRKESRSRPGFTRRAQSTDGVLHGRGRMSQAFARIVEFATSYESPSRYSGRQ